MAGDLRGTILGLCVAFGLMSIGVVALRFHVRSVNRVKIGIDDWTILGAMVNEHMTR